MTVKRPVRFEGVGLHGGQPVRMAVLPAPAGHGIVFSRVDVGGDAGLVPARHDRVSDLRLCTKLSNAHGVSVGTVEHLMAALAGSGISDALIELDGPEVPIMDGSARIFVDAFLLVGVEPIAGGRTAIRIERPVEVRLGDRMARLEPAEGFGIDYRIDFDDPAIGEQSISLELSRGAVIDELADCRTFCKLSEVEALRKAGLARGGSLENAIVVDHGRVLNPEGLRREDEFVRHKALDAVGDLALAGAPIVGRYVAERAGHEVTNALLHALFARPDAWSWCELAPERSLDLRRAAPPRPGTARPVAV